jgi:hypothetical protein
MRSSSFLAVLVVTAAVAALVVVRFGTDVEVEEGTRGTVTLLGDSLNVGIERYLPSALPRWRIVANDRVGRSTPEGIEELEAGRPPLSSWVVVSLGTNDPADQVEAFEADVARVLRLIGPNRCVAWATIWRDGTPADSFNNVLRAAARANRRLRLVEWAEMIEKHPELLAGDGLHGNETGYRERAGAVADAVRSCVPAQTVSGR